MRNKIALAALAAALMPAAALAETDRVDVAYDALKDGRTAEAVAKLDAGTSDPAALINLGTAYARQGKVAEARAMFTAAAESREHYYLELADGSWVDSRKAAKMALERLDKTSNVAMR